MRRAVAETTPVEEIEMINFGFGRLFEAFDSCERFWLKTLL